MNGLDHSQRQDYLSLKKRSSSWQSDDHHYHHNHHHHHQEMMMIRRSMSHHQVMISGLGASATTTPNPSSRFPAGGLLDRRHDDAVAAVVPAVTVVLEGRSICHRISLHKHGSYRSLAKALRQMFGGGGGGFGDDCGADESCDGDDLDLSNAVPGHLIAYEDMENDLLLAGDLDWKDFVRVAKRIRILPAKSNSRKARSEGV